MSRGWRLALPLGFLVAIHLASLFGGFLAPNSPIEQNRELSWAPPTKLRFIDEQGRFHLRPFVYPLVPDPEEFGRYREDRSTPYRLRYLVRGEPYRLAGLFPTDLHYLGVDSPAKLFLLGTDGFGRDLFARLLVGGRVSLLSGLSAATVALSLGVLLGGLAGYYGRRVDRVLMGVTEVFIALPWLYLLLGLRAFLPLDLTAAEALLLFVGLVGFIGWARPARIVRGLVRSVSAHTFVTAARGIGATDLRILLRYVFPQALALTSTLAAITIPRYVLTEVTLSFLGLGIAEPLPTWGNLLAATRHYHVLSNHPYILTPALLLILVFVAYQDLALLGRSPLQPLRATT